MKEKTQNPGAKDTQREANAGASIMERLHMDLSQSVFGPKTLSEIASIMGRKGAKKGARKAGKARMRMLTAAQRSELARNAARARWAKARKQ